MAAKRFQTNNCCCCNFPDYSGDPLSLPDPWPYNFDVAAGASPPSFNYDAAGLFNALVNNIIGVVAGLDFYLTGTDCFTGTPVTVSGSYDGSGNATISGLVIGRYYFWGKYAHDTTAEGLTNTGSFLATANTCSLTGTPSASITAKLWKMDRQAGQGKFTTNTSVMFIGSPGAALPGGITLRPFPSSTVTGSGLVKTANGWGRYFADGFESSDASLRATCAAVDYDTISVGSIQGVFFNGDTTSSLTHGLSYDGSGNATITGLTIGHAYFLQDIGTANPSNETDVDFDGFDLRHLYGNNQNVIGFEYGFIAAATSIAITGAPTQAVGYSLYEVPLRTGIPLGFVGYIYKLGTANTTPLPVCQYNQVESNTVGSVALTWNSGNYSDPNPIDFWAGEICEFSLGCDQFFLFYGEDSTTWCYGYSFPSLVIEATLPPTTISSDPLLIIPSATVEQFQNVIASGSYYDNAGHFIFNTGVNNGVFILADAGNCTGTSPGLPDNIQTATNVTLSGPANQRVTAMVVFQAGDMTLTAPTLCSTSGGDVDPP